MAVIRRESKHAKCPFYKGYSDSVIYCEGPLEQTLLHIAFGSADERRAYMIVYCNDKYQQCILHEPLQRKYRRNNTKREGK